MEEFWIYLLKFLEEHWDSLCIGAGLLWNGLKKPPKTKEEKQADKKAKDIAKAEKRANKSVLKANEDVEHLKELKNA